MENHEITGRKVFFLYPHSVIQGDLVDTLLANEYEIYFLKDHRTAPGTFSKYPGSICFINLDEGLPEPEWQKFILSARENPDTKDTLFGILSYTNDKDLAKKYLLEISIPCGFVHLKQGIKEGTDIILKVLEANEAKGRRKYVRAQCAEDPLAVLNLVSGTKMYSGSIMDISSVGLACTFDADPGLIKNTLLSDIQLKLRGTVIKVGGIVLGLRENGQKIYVILFHPQTAENIRVKIRKYIHGRLQQLMEKN